MCNERGGVIDDLYVYRIGDSTYLLIINASRIEADVVWLEKQFASFARCGEMKLVNVSDVTGAIAVQGPLVVRFIDQCLGGVAIGGTLVASASELKKNQIGEFEFGDETICVARTGYTGEDGFEIIAPNEIIEAVWCKILDAGRPFGIKPCGLGARDTLRTEVCYPLYGHELDENTTPIEAGVGFFVALDKGDFIGRSVLAEQKASGVGKKCVAFKMADKSAPPRPQYPIWANGAKVGEVVSGTQSPSLNVGIGMGYVSAEVAKVGTVIEIEIRGKRSPAVIVKKPIYKVC
jgi:aminomethyltransferase